jgi:uncharacterized membrane protein YoaK (UPF0700 family)
MEKAQQVSESFALAVLLTLSGGFMDAYSYIGREHVFANAQTGNILLFGIHLATAKENGFLYFSIIGIFVIGAIGGHFGVRVWREKAIIVSAVLLLAGFVLMLKNHEP